jgi:quercetin dioxygenase-like cupin family protein
VIEFEHYVSGHLFGITYLFTDAGDALPTHEHEPDTFHNIIVLSGVVTFHCGTEVRELRVGDVFDFDGTQMHTIRCVAPGSRILNLLIHGAPVGYEKLPKSERKGVLAT